MEMIIFTYIIDNAYVDIVIICVTCSRKTTYAILVDDLRR